MQGFIFGKGTDIPSPDALAKRRALLSAMQARNAAVMPKNLWEGLNSATDSITGALQSRQLDSTEAEAKAGADAAYAPVIEAIKSKGKVGNDALVGAMSNEWLSDPQQGVVSALLKQNMEADAPLTKWQQAQLAKDDQITPYQREYLNYLKGKAAESGNDYGLNPVWAQDEAGNWQLYQPNKGGGAPARVAFPAGVNPQPQVNFLDTGTGYEPRATKGGQPVGAAIPKDVAGEAAQKEIGKGTGEATNDLKSIQSKMPGLEKVVGELDQLAGGATYTSGGQIYDIVRKEIGMAPRDAAVARTEYISKVDNQILPLLRDTFGAAFTVKEGDSLRATLGDPNKTPEEKQVVLKSFIEQKRRDVEALAVKAGQDGSQNAGGQKRLKFNPDTGDLE